jgi:hypothetical protein
MVRNGRLDTAMASDCTNEQQILGAVDNLARIASAPLMWPVYLA